MNNMHVHNDAGLARLPAVRQLIELAITEDLGRGDVTTDAVIANRQEAGECEIVARQSMVVFGLEVAAAVFHHVDAGLMARPLVEDGEPVAAGRAVMQVRGSRYSILEAERTALNFLQRLSGVATLSRQFAEAVAGTGTRVIDTRKTTPGFRVLEKAAVRAGGCRNHRFDLGSGVLIKDNHIAACGSITAAVERARERAPHSLRIEVEVDTLEQLDEALDAGADVFLLDNMTPEKVATAAQRIHQRNGVVEVSGGITLRNVRAYADVGADIISVGALTHSAPAVDISLDLRVDRATGSQWT